MITNQSGIHHSYNQLVVIAKLLDPEVEKKPMNSSSKMMLTINEFSIFFFQRNFFQLFFQQI